MIPVRMKTTYAGPAGTCDAGKVIWLPNDEAKAVIDAKSGEECTDDAAIERAVQPRRERATGRANRKTAAKVTPPPVKPAT